MTPFSTLLVGAAASLTMSADLPASSFSTLPVESPVLHLECDTGGAAFCRSLAEAITAQFPLHQVELTSREDAIKPDVTFVAEKATNTSLSGHLEWQVTPGNTGRMRPAGQGPTLELTVMDATLNDRMLAAFAAQLVRHSNLPL